MRMALLIIGVLAALVGIWWVLQGTLSLWPAGQMAGDHDWAYRGAAVALAGLVLVGASRLLPRKR